MFLLEYLLHLHARGVDSRCSIKINVFLLVLIIVFNTLIVRVEKVVEPAQKRTISFLMREIMDVYVELVINKKTDSVRRKKQNL